MLVSLKWLRELVDVPIDIKEFVDRLDLTGTAVEAVHHTGAALKGVVVGRILAKERHPEADRLWVTTIDVGDAEPLTIVCGAQNFEAGDKVPVALVGATLPNGLTIKKSKLRGVASNGMNCSADELGLGGAHDGLLILPAEAPVGQSFAAYRGLSDDVLELEITPNRPDCLSVAGVAREVGAVLDHGVRILPSKPAESGEPIAESVAVAIEDAELCPRYAARLIRGVRIGSSPEWLVERVVAAGARPISNIVDITNYVMFELGHPLHAFDAGLLARDADGRIRIGVRRAQDGETLKTLDGVERRLTADSLLITDPSGPIALAGVMGGEATEVNAGTVDVLLESASFAPASISRTSRQLGLVSEASMRFERGVDRAGCIEALDRAAALMAEYAGGTVAPGVVDEYPLPAVPRRISLRMSQVNGILGAEIAAQEAAAILGRLGCVVAAPEEALEDAVTLVVDVPTFRPDLEREIDLIEEILRVFGMDRIEATLPAGRGRIGALTREQSWRERVGATLRASGLNETMTYTFADPADPARMRETLAEDEVQVELHNPMSAEQSVLRRSLLPGLLRAVSYNQRRGVEDVHLYETGTVFHTSLGRKRPKEHGVVAGVLAGAWHRPAWNEPAVGLEFFDGKGVIEALLRELGLARVEMRAAEVPHLQPGRSAEVVMAGEIVGWLGEVHPLVLDSFDTQGPVTAFELNLAALLRSAQDVKPFSEVPRYPGVDLDVAIVVPEDVTARKIEKSIVSAGGKLLYSARLFDVYRGPGVEPGKKSLAFELVYRAQDRTLTAEEVAANHERLVRKVCSAVGGELRA
ncbi:MAG: phenylalanine--tRNA ligase subunit beta [Coriobacteriia bacterium]|nr:phenylalanine--tRNA ligase subunit beta [Coriobacteriia bacterium]